MDTPSRVAVGAVEAAANIRSCWFGPEPGTRDIDDLSALASVLEIVPPPFVDGMWRVFQ